MHHLSTLNTQHHPNHFPHTTSSSSSRFNFETWANPSKENMKQSRVSFLGLGLGLVMLIAVGSINTTQGADDLATKCSQVIQKVLPCLEFATGKEATPKKECCDATTSIKESNPECLCYIIQETHKGSPQVKQLGIQEAKLLQLPSVCKVKNATVANCPSKCTIFPSFPSTFIFLYLPNI